MDYQRQPHLLCVGGVLHIHPPARKIVVSFELISLGGETHLHQSANADAIPNSSVEFFANGVGCTPPEVLLAEPRNSW